MTRASVLQKNKPFLLSYLHGTKLDLETILRALLEHEEAVCAELKEKDPAFERAENADTVGRMVFEDLAEIPTPPPIGQLTDRLSKDIDSKRKPLAEIGQSQKYLVPEEGTID